MTKLESAILTLNGIGRPVYTKISSVAFLLTVTLFLIAVLSTPLLQPQKLICFAVFPIVTSEMAGVGFTRTFMKSLWVLPFVVFIAVFNPFFDSNMAFTIGEIKITEGWISFISIIIRGLLCVQAVIIMTICLGFYEVCNALKRIGCPRVLVTQIQFTFRYLTVITDEALGMQRARNARGFGRKSYPLSMWGKFTGQLLIRSYERATRIHHAMLSRGFTGTMPQTFKTGMDFVSYVFLIIWTVVFAVIRFFPINLTFINTVV